MGLTDAKFIWGPKWFFLLALLLSPFSCAFQMRSSSPVPRPSGRVERPAGPELDPNATEFPAASLFDASYLLEPPAGRHGFLTVTADGHFAFADGTPVRFWGINVAAESVFQPRERIDAAIAAIRRAGFNLVRLHHLDETDRGILAADPRQGFRDDRLGLLDYWIYRLRESGIYVYLDLLDYRTFTAAEGVVNALALGRGAKPYAVFDPTLIARQKEYARRLLREHVNRYTGRPYAQDPTIALLELYDENGLFSKRRRWRQLAEPYRTRLRRLWNEFLRERYATTDRLRSAWEGALAEGESLEEGTVELPAFTAGEVQAPFKAPLRQDDGARFAYRLHRRYFREMKAFLREEVGVKVPLTAVGDVDLLPDTYSIAEELDFIGTNFYWDHPIFAPRAAWKLPFFFTNCNPLTTRQKETFAPFTAVARVAGKPLVVREWNYCYPNAYRAGGVLEAAAYGCLQDYDALILFTFGLRPEEQRIGYFAVQRDPTRWGLTAIGAQTFLRRDVAPARRKVEIGCSEGDVFRFRESYLTDLHRLSWVSQVAHRFFLHALQPTADLTVAWGQVAADYRGERCVLSARQLPQGRTYFRYPLRPRATKAAPFAFAGLLYDAGEVREKEAGPRFELEALVSLGLLPLGVAGELNRAYGFYDRRRRNFVFTALPPEEQLRAALDALGKIHADQVSHRFVDRGVFLADTGEVERDSAKGRLIIVTPRLCAVAGNLRSRSPLRLGAVEATVASSLGALVVQSLEDKPLSESEHFVLKLVTVAYNSGQDWYPPRASAKGPGRVYWTLSDPGRLPIVTRGEPSSTPTIVRMEGKRVLEVYLKNGTWELVREGNRWRFFCDTPDVRVRVDPEASHHRAEALLRSGRRLPLNPRPDFLYPPAARVVVVETEPRSPP